MRVIDLMDPAPVVAEVPGARRDALRLFSKHPASGLPVVRAGTRELVGLLTRADLQRDPDEERIEALMTLQPPTLGADVEAIEAARVFHRQRVHTLPVVRGRELVGVLTPLDLLRETQDAGPIARLLTQPAVPLHQDATLAAAWETMRRAKQDALPVLDDDARLVGVLAESDIFGEIPVAEQRGQALPRRPVRDIMVRAVITAASHDSVEEAAQRMVKARVSQLPVVDEGRLTGIVTDLDLMRAWFP
ncbi:MAG TPA: CBS domain-containing protein [Candidatus Thermoplasmatota archaeon]|nr:CBS domain-containing protein [Candidatus Thermoplasmatota archaeon]